MVVEVEEHSPLATLPLNRVLLELHQSLVLLCPKVVVGEEIETPTLQEKMVDLVAEAVDHLPQNQAEVAILVMELINQQQHQFPLKEMMVAHQMVVVPQALVVAAVVLVELAQLLPIVMVDQVEMEVHHLSMELM